MAYHLYITSRNYSPWSFRPWLLMRQLDIPFHEKLADLKSGSLRQPHWAAFSPLAHVPCLHHILADDDSDDAPLVLWESIAIVDHLAENHPDKSVYPTDKRARAWARSAVAEMHAGFGFIREEMSMNIGMRIKLVPGEVSEGLEKDLKRVDQLWTEGLERFGGPWLAGTEFGAVDAFYAPVVLRLQVCFFPLLGWVGRAVCGW
jgi:glutathione S-transferase